MADPKDRRARPTLPEAIDTRAILGRDTGEKPVLVVLTGPQVGQRIILECRALIGQDPEADLMIVDDRVEWHHAAVFPRDGEWVLCDLSGDRRTELNGRPVTEAVLEDDDQLLIGGTVLRFELHGPVEQAFDEVIVERLTKDDLTGLLSRRTFDVELASTIGAAARQGRPLSLLVIDIDGVKPINDAHGHLAGARVIGSVGKRIGALIGGRGPACRLGGDEFGVCLPGTSVQEALEVAEEIRRAVAAHRVEHDGVVLGVTVSIGVSGFPQHGDKPLQLLRRADDAMYAIKRNGGDGVGPYVPFSG